MRVIPELHRIFAHEKLVADAEFEVAVIPVVPSESLYTPRSLSNLFILNLP